jgi:DNA repair exonuclease SbcCD ATPase subunit
MYLTLPQVAKATGKSRSAIARAIKAEKLPAKKDEKGQWQITPEHLLQAFPDARLKNRPEPVSEVSSPPAGADSREHSFELLEKEIQWLREQLRQQAKQEQENHRELVRLLKQETEERVRLTETLAAPLEKEVYQLRQELDRSQEKIRELRRLLAQEVEERQRAIREQSHSHPEKNPESPGFWSRWFSK